MKRAVPLLAFACCVVLAPIKAANAADLLRPAGPGLKEVPTIEPAPIWSGVYAGVSLGYGSGDSEAAEVNGPRNYIAEFDGAIGSLHLGWQRQVGHLVGGVELQSGYLGQGSNVTRDVAGGSITSGVDLGAYAALSGRLGVVLHPSWLLYGRAGIAVAEVDGGTTQTCVAPGLCSGAQSTPVSATKVESPTWGLLLGAGIERQLGDRWTGRLDYQFLSFREELALPAIDGPGWNHDVDVHAINIGLSYRF